MGLVTLGMYTCLVKSTMKIVSALGRTRVVGVDKRRRKSVYPVAGSFRVLLMCICSTYWQQRFP